jgi:hypothetical protein
VINFPDLRVGDPVRHGSLAVFPLFDGSQPGAEYVLAEDGIGSGFSPSKLRYLLKSSVGRSVAERREHRFDQLGMWREVSIAVAV